MSEPKLPLLLEEDMLIFSPWDALVNTADKTPLWGAANDNVCFRKSAATGITFRIYGTRGISDLTGKPTIEDMEVWLGDGEITNGLSEAFLQSLVDACLEENS